MAATAILIGNSEYQSEQQLPCCAEDVEAIQLLLASTGRFDAIHVHKNVSADEMRNALRTGIPDGSSFDEIFLYFSGHGAQVSNNLFLCGVSFDGSRPNETGLSHEDIMNLVRSSNPELLVTVIDACFSGTRLVKGDHPLKHIAESGLRNVIQFSSSMDDQTSLAGERLSEFTRAFLEASARKTEGIVYYSDITNSLRDEFIANDDQTPFFVSQGTGREILVDDATKLAGFRSEFLRRWPLDEDGGERENAINSVIASDETLSPKQLLIAAEGKMGDQIKVKRLVDDLFDGIQTKLSVSSFAEFFESAYIEHPTYREGVTREFLIRVLSKESRPDNLVVARMKPEYNSIGYLRQMTNALAAMQSNWTENYDLELNCTITRAQMKLTLTPKYMALQQLQLVLSCAPSLNQCYIFEIVTQHPRTDWGAFDPQGSEVVRRWYKLDWDAKVDSLVAKIIDALSKAVGDHIDETTKRLSKN